MRTRVWLSLLVLVLASRAVLAASGGELLDLAALKGQVVYVDFWASWCAPCRESFPWMNRMQDELRKDGLVIIAVNVDHDHGDAEHFLREHPARFRVVFDPDAYSPSSLMSAACRPVF
jgi:cytochrome c biogenesis protein CcmG, thiol:disulfide interchange protein DsbE